MTTTDHKPITSTEFLKLPETTPTSEFIKRSEFLKLPETTPTSEFIKRSLARTEVFGTGANG
jgi:hypothetical protein